MGHTTLVKCKASIEEFGLEMVKQILEASIVFFLRGL